MSEQSSTPNSSVDALAARIAALTPAGRADLEIILGSLAQDALPPVDRKAARLELLENGTRSLPIHQRLALHVMGELAMHCAFSVLDIQGDGLEHFFRTISDALESGFQRDDWREVKEIHDAQ